MVWVLLLFGAPIFIILEMLIYEVHTLKRRVKNDPNYRNKIERVAMNATFDTMLADRKRMRRLFFWYYLIANIANIIYSYV
jgi:uncharacterized protein YcaQ